MLGSKYTVILYFLIWAEHVNGGHISDKKYPKTPDITQTPGDLCTVSSPDFKEYRYDEKIPYCFRDVSGATKKLVYRNYKIPSQDVINYTVDHLIPLSIGGSNEITNLWPEHKEIKAKRPNLEYEIYYKLKAGEITQKEAVEVIIKNKFESYKNKF